MRRLIASVVALLILLAVNNPVFAKEQKEITYIPTEEGGFVAEYQFAAESPETGYEWETSITREGKEYLLVEGSPVTEVLEELVETLPVELHEVVTYENLETQEAPQTHQVEQDGVTYTLELDGEIEFLPVEAEDGTITVTGTTDYGFQTGQPKMASTKNVKYEDNGREKTAVASFVDFTTGKETWDSGYSTPAKFIGDLDVKYYVLDQSQIPNTGDTVPITGYEDVILKHLGLDPSETRIDNAEWSGKPKTENGQTVRTANITWSRKGRTYTANYRAEVPSMKTVYHAVAQYRLDDVTVETDVVSYMMKTTAVYEPVPQEVARTSPVVVVLVSVFVILLVAGGIIAAVILIKRRKNGEDY